MGRDALLGEEEVSWLVLDNGLGACCCEGGLGQADPVSAVSNLLTAIVGEGAKFLPESKEMRQRREAELEQTRLEYEVERARRAAGGQKVVMGLGVLVVGGLALWALTRRKKK